MKINILTPKVRVLLPLLSNFKDIFYLAGGTGLALQIGHRVSVDFDLFSSRPIKKTLLGKVEKVFSAKPQRVLVNNADEFTVLIDDVKFTFLHYPFPVILPLSQSGPMPTLSIKEIFVTKAYAIGRRGEFKDYIDMYVGLRDGHVSLAEIIDLARQKYGEAFNDRLFLEQLVYLDDVDEVKIMMTDGSTPSKADLESYFTKLVGGSGVLN